jgi:hypothetical protein
MPHQSTLTFPCAISGSTTSSRRMSRGPWNTAAFTLRRAVTRPRHRAPWIVEACVYRFGAGGSGSPRWRRSHGQHACSDAVAAGVPRCVQRPRRRRVMSFFTDDCVFDMPRGPAPGGRRLTGKQQVGAGIRSRFDGIPDVQYGDDRHWTCATAGYPSGRSAAPRGQESPSRFVDATSSSSPTAGRALGDRAGPAREIEPRSPGLRREPLDDPRRGRRRSSRRPVRRGVPPHPTLALLQLLVGHGGDDPRPARPVKYKKWTCGHYGWTEVRVEILENGRHYLPEERPDAPSSSSATPRTGNGPERARADETVHSRRSNQLANTLAIAALALHRQPSRQSTPCGRSPCK